MAAEESFIEVITNAVKQWSFDDLDAEERACEEAAQQKFLDEGLVSVAVKEAFENFVDKKVVDIMFGVTHTE